MRSSELATSLGVIERALQRLGRRTLHQALQPGISADLIQAALGPVELVAPAELEEVYGWRDGTSTASNAAIDDIHMFPGFYLLSIKDAITNYRVFIQDARWRTGWLPLFANGGGDFYVLDVSSQEASPVRHFRIDEVEHPVEFRSLAAMFATLAQAFERGVFYVDSGGYLEMDDVVFGALAAELNPEVDWWHE